MHLTQLARGHLLPVVLDVAAHDRVALLVRRLMLPRPRLEQRAEHHQKIVRVENARRHRERQRVQVVREETCDGDGGEGAVHVDRVLLLAAVVLVRFG